MLTGEALQKFRLQIYKDWGPGPNITPETPLTCDECQRNEECEFAFDYYNTDGDCLDSK